MTSIEWLAEQLEKHYTKIDIKNTVVFEQAKEMHKKEIIDVFFEGAYGGDNISGEQYYQETFVSKGSDDTLKDYHIVDTNEMIDHIAEANKMVELPQQEKAEESWEGCDGCTEQDEVMYKNGYVKGYNAAIGELPKEISDEEIEKEAEKRSKSFNGFTTYEKSAWVMACKWYREQLKQKK